MRNLPWRSKHEKSKAFKLVTSSVDGQTEGDITTDHGPNTKTTAESPVKESLVVPLIRVKY